MAETSRRPYHSPRREAAARETREAVLGAARRQFRSAGYEGTTLASIARAAGVSLATVKLVEGTKARLLVAAIQAIIRTDDSGAPLVGQSWWQRLVDEGDPAAALREFAAHVGSALDRQVDLLEVVWQAAPTDPEIARLEEGASIGRREDIRQLAEAFAARGALRSGLETAAAADTIWALGSPQVFFLMVRRGGWPRERWEAWLADSLIRLLLA